MARQRNNLPSHLPRLIGRDEALVAVRERLVRTECGLLTLTGSGGSGKTLLALAVATVLLDTFADGVWVVELAPLADPALVAGAVLASMDVQEQPGRSALETLVEGLGRREVLLVLDNCEHLVEACAAVADELLRSCPGIRILATSREPLRIAGEQTWRVPTLSAPDERTVPTLKELVKFAAVRLFVERAYAVEPAFELSTQNGPAVVAICARLDGLPLAAARVRVLAPEQILERLDSAFQLLVGGSRTAPTRQQTLRATLDWSYRLLATEEQRLFARLAVFAGAWTLDAAEAVSIGGDVDGNGVLDLLEALVDKSLVVAEPHSGGIMRYHLVETLRRNHADYFIALGEQAEPHLRGGPEFGAWLARLAMEQHNLRAALRWCTDRAEIERGLRLGGAVWRFWYKRGGSAEGIEWLDLLLRFADTSARTAARARVLNGAGVLAIHAGHNTAAQSLIEESLAIWRELGTPRMVAACLGSLGALAMHMGDYVTARPLFEQALDVAAAQSDNVQQGDHAAQPRMVARRRRGLHCGVRRSHQFSRTLQVGRGRTRRHVLHD